MCLFWCMATVREDESICVTPEMAKAGSIELSSWDDGVDPGREIVAAVYRAMVIASRAKPVASSEDHSTATELP